jgi:general secretion pathway protein N
MMLHRFICAFALAAGIPPVALATSGHATSQGPGFAALDTNSLSGAGSLTAPPMPELGPAALTPAAVDPVPNTMRADLPARAGREPRGNPLWAIPLKSLTATRERPLFLPSRRPPAPPAVAGPPPPPAPPPPPPAAPERPRVSLVGAVAGEAEGIAILLDQATRDIIRLRIGETLSGWTLRSVRGREATLQKDRESMLLAMPAPTDPPGAIGAPPMMGQFGAPPLPPAGGPVALVPGTSRPVSGQPILPGQPEPEL